MTNAKDLKELVEYSKAVDFTLDSSLKFYSAVSEAHEECETWGKRDKLTGAKPQTKVDMTLEQASMCAKFAAAAADDDDQAEFKQKLKEARNALIKAQKYV